jgi:hypothetical protein
MNNHYAIAMQEESVFIHNGGTFQHIQRDRTIAAARQIIGESNGLIASRDILHFTYLLSTETPWWPTRKSSLIPR